MIELKYKITDADIKAEDRRSCLEFFAVYASIGLLGLAVGIVAVVLRQSTPLLVLGIIMIVLAAVLCVIATLLVVPHNPSIKSVIFTGDENRVVTLGERELSVSAEDGTRIASFGYARFIGMKKRKDYIRLTLEKNVVLIVKCEPQELEKVRSFIVERMKNKNKSEQAVPTENSATEKIEPQSELERDDDAENGGAEN